MVAKAMAIDRGAEGEVLMCLLEALQYLDRFSIVERDGELFIFSSWATAFQAKRPARLSYPSSAA
jgi:hypothetical protein